MSTREDELPPIRDTVPDAQLPGDLVADLFRPTVVAPLTPLVVLLHGGFWRAEYDRTHLRPMARALAHLGFVVVTPEYRRVGNGGGWPATFDDVAHSVGKAPELAASAVGTQLGPVVLVGHSAGGHLALWAAAVAPPNGLRAVIALAPVADLSRAFRDRVGGNAVHDLMGGGPDDLPERYRAADPTLLDAPRVDVTIVHGSDDVVVPLTCSVGYVQRHLRTRLVVADAGHFALIDPDSSAWSLVVDAINRGVPKEGGRSGMADQTSAADDVPKDVDATTLGQTRRALHAVAEWLLAGPAHRRSGTIRLKVTRTGIATHDGQVETDGTDLVVRLDGHDRRIPLDGQLAEIASAAGLDGGAPDGVYSDSSGCDGATQISLDPAAVRLLVDWFNAGVEAFASFAAAETPVLWPEHFDLGIAVDKVNYGISPGDVDSPEPYAYVGPWTVPTGDFWNAPFGAKRTRAQTPDASTLVVFFDEGRAAATVG